MMKLLVTGFNGFVAGSILTQAPTDWEVHGIGRSAMPDSTGNIRYHHLDMLDEKALKTVFMDIRPNAVIHAAGIANIDFCENNRAIAYAVNVGATERIGALCADINAKLVLCSTDTVFDGQKSFYTEQDALSSVNYYGETKIKAEQVVKDAGAAHVVARLALVMGLPVMGTGNSFLAEMIAKLENREPLKMATNEIRTPVDVISLGAALLELASSDFTGTIHLSGNSRVNRFEMANRIAAALGFSGEKILPINSSELKGRAPRPADVSLSNEKARSILKTPFLSLEEGLKLSLEKANKKIKTASKI
jgi:dTDP-4-dehydrorhamnose reductase